MVSVYSPFGGEIAKKACTRQNFARLQILMDEKYGFKKLRFLSGAKTSGGRSADVAIAIVRIPPVHVRAVRIRVADVHEVAVGITGFFYLWPSEAMSVCIFLDTLCINMWRMSAPARDKQSCLYWRKVSVNTFS